jgi:predicted alpha/beta-hydrolase family hydrolase
MTPMPPIEIETPHGTARASLLPAPGTRPVAALVLGHGAGGGIAARDLQAAGRAAASQGLAVALIEQPYRVAGRRAPPAAPRLDVAWLAVIERLQQTELAGMALVVGGRSSGARVACRTAAASGAIGVLCLAFPLQPPQRAAAAQPAPSRLPELEAVPVPVLVVQGTRDPFGLPPAGPGRTVVAVAGDHGLKADLAAVGAAVSAWLGRLPGV